VRQATFAKVFEKLRGEGVRQPERFGAFVCGVCDNMAREHIRKRARMDQFPEDGPEPADSRVNIESDLVTGEKKQLVRDVLDELSKRDRELIQAIFVQERDKDEVCRQLGVDREYLRVLLHRAKERIRKRLAKQQSTGK
jgi:RNA polymerase sigma-70 factor (ECF subfamily)